ncbi:alpha-amylase family glycosyl hydrolase [Chloroflexus sp.]|uniref:alpha-amylase family glycosyl hydrolase n=1 Tax=Chloroflexus sp. TaxID=1904827 RepID=UPI002ACE61EB|nr:alpha-amylase family glycosyl hydrolase [Chloroflexus sp.]
MHEWERIPREAARSLARLLPRVEQAFAAAGGNAADWVAFEQRLRREWPRLFELLLGLYGSQYDFFYHLEQLLIAMAQSWSERPLWLKQRDAVREADSEWFQSERMMGGVLYVDRFCGTLNRLREFIPYFNELGLTYLHLMPLFAAPEGNNDGGYAVSSYREVNPQIGTTAELAALAQELDRAGISLVLDFVFNHTSDEHEWARRAQAGDPDYQEFYFLFPDRTMPDAYERTLREIFPTVRRGSFTWRPDMQRWVWTTFNSFQWDLNYANPAVFRAMAAEMLFLANLGVAVLRLDAVPFIWKRLGTNCENQPEAHQIIQAFNAIARVAAPALLFKSEAIVHPDDVLSYISPHECQLSYNPLLMALLWESLATREVKLLAHSLSHRFRLPAGCAWINYLRSHDDIGWTFDDNDARAVGIDPWGHRQFLNAFYTGRFTGSFARGLPFQENPDTGDARVSGTLASLAGLEQALGSGDPQMIDTAIRRIVLLHSVILSIGGIPLLYLGDEVGTVNDYSYVTDPSKAVDSRWVHRPTRNQAGMDHRHDPATASGRIFGELVRLIRLRASLPALRDGAMDVVRSDNRHVLAYVRRAGSQRVLVLANFSEYPQPIAGNLLRMYGPGVELFDVVAERAISANEVLVLQPYQFVWLTPVW